MLSPEHQSARMSKITNDGLNRSVTGCFIALPKWQQRASKGNIMKVDKKAQLMLAYPRDAKTMKKIPPFRSYNKFQSTRKSGVYSN